jgi:RNA ligase
MLKINSLAEFKTKVLQKQEIRESDIGHNSICFCYMIAAEDTFSGPDNLWIKECRGITFNKNTGIINGRPLSKFFNVNERPETLVSNIDWTKVTRVMDKRDGSMITTVDCGYGESDLGPSYSFDIKTKKTFDSDVANQARAFLKTQHNISHMIAYLNGENYTAIFEYTAPTNRIVINYKQEELRLLHIRNNITGEYMKMDKLLELATKYNVLLVDHNMEFFNNIEVVNHGSSLVHQLCFDINAMLEVAKIRQGVEGWVVQFENGDMVKIKTDWYLKLHRSIIFLRERDIAQQVLDETIDDLKSLLVGEGVDITEILAIERRVTEYMTNIVNHVEDTVHRHGHLSVKDFAIMQRAIADKAASTDINYFGLLMSRYNGKEPKYKEFFEKNILKLEFSLNQINQAEAVGDEE